MNIGIGIGIGFRKIGQTTGGDTGGIDFEFLDGANFQFLDGTQFELLEQA